MDPFTARLILFGSWLLGQATAPAPYPEAPEPPPVDPAQEAARREAIEWLQAYLDPSWSFFSEDELDAIYDRNAAKVAEQVGQTLDQIQANIGRRGLLGSSLGTEAELAVTDQQAEALANMLMDLEARNAELTNQYQMQAGNFLGGMQDPNFQRYLAELQAWQGGLDAYRTSQDAAMGNWGNIGDLLGTLLALYAGGTSPDSNPFQLSINW